MPPPPDIGVGYKQGATFYETITAAIADISQYGFDSAERVEMWVRRIRDAAARSMTPLQVVERTLNETMRSIYRDKIDRGTILKFHPGVSLFTLAKVKPKLRNELDRRIMANAALIKNNREEAVATTVRRFVGWSTSIPDGGSDAVDKMDVKADLKKELYQLPYAERRVAIDQGHKFVANLNNIIAVDSGAIAAQWHSHAGEQGYNYRPAHKAREGKMYLLRDCWAQERGLVKPGPAGYYDEVTAVGEEVFCRCWLTYLYSLRRLPDDMLTVAGREEMAKARRAA